MFTARSLSVATRFFASSLFNFKDPQFCFFMTLCFWTKWPTLYRDLDAAFIYIYIYRRWCRKGRKSEWVREREREKERERERERERSPAEPFMGSGRRKRAGSDRMRSEVPRLQLVCQDWCSLSLSLSFSLFLFISFFFALLDAGWRSHPCHRFTHHAIDYDRLQRCIHLILWTPFCFDVALRQTIRWMDFINWPSDFAPISSGIADV